MGAYNGLEPIKREEHLDAQLIKQSEQYLIKNVGQEILDLMLILATEMNIDEIMFDKNTPNLISAAERKRLKNSLVGDAKTTFAKSDHTCQEELVEYIFELADLDSCGIRLKQDKKRDREFIAEFVARQKSCFEAAANHDKLYICAIMTYSELTKSLIWTAGKCVPGLVSFISRFSSANPKMDTIMEAFSECQEKVVQQLRHPDDVDADDLENSLQGLYTAINETNIHLSPTMQRRTSRQASKKESESRDEVQTRVEKPSVGSDAEGSGEEVVVVEKKRGGKGRRARRAD